MLSTMPLWQLGNVRYYTTSKSDNLSHTETSFYSRMKFERAFLSITRDLSDAEVISCRSNNNITTGKQC